MACDGAQILEPSAKGGETPTREDTPLSDDSGGGNYLTAASTTTQNPMSWKIARKALIKVSAPGANGGGAAGGADAGGSLEGADPELCITLLERGLNFTGLKARLKSADQAWMEHFITIGGIPALFDALEALGRKGFSSIMDALRQLECVGCVRAVMNNRFGLEFIVEARGESFVKRLTEGERKGEKKDARLARTFRVCPALCSGAASSVAAHAKEGVSATSYSL